MYLTIIDKHLCTIEVIKFDKTFEQIGREFLNEKGNENPTEEEIKEEVKDLIRGCMDDYTSGCPENYMWSADDEMPSIIIHHSYLQHDSFECLMTDEERKKINSLIDRICESSSPDICLPQDELPFQSYLK